MGIGDWGLGVGGWGVGGGGGEWAPNPQPPIPNPQSPHESNIKITTKTKLITNNITIIKNKK